MTEPATQGQALHALAMQIRYDLTAAQTKITELLRQIAQLNLDAPVYVICPHCELKLAGPRTLAEHLYHSHNGPEPPHWADLERLIDTPPGDEPPRAAVDEPGEFVPAEKKGATP